MRVNSRVFTERQDMLGEIKIPNCPSQFKVIAENIINLATKPGFSVGEYHTMTELDKKLMIAYWAEYDGLADVLENATHTYGGFADWYINKATSAELLRRSREFLVSHNYLLIREEVHEHALQAGENMRKAIRSR